MVHLTNDAIQKKCPEYGKHELGNKLSFAEYSLYFDALYEI
jgi:tubulin monoglycylase TTLL3/8